MRTREEKLAYLRNYRVLNKERLKEKQKGYSNTWKKRHKKDVSIYNNEYHQKHYSEYSERKKEYHRLWRLKNREKRNEYARNYRIKRINDIQFRLSKLLRTRLHHALKNKSKPGSAIKDMGCTVEELKSYIESKFSEGMSWENWGYRGWHIDHIRPLASFDLSDREQLLESVRYTNLQPLWAGDNIRKGKRITVTD